MVAGTVTKVEWQNPHVYVYVDAKDAQGKVEFSSDFYIIKPKDSFSSGEGSLREAPFW